MTGRIRGLDGLRAIAVVLVFLHHNTPIGSKLNLGAYGVWLFFVLSGFLIIGILHKARRRIEAGGSLGAEFGGFFRRRSLRIFPVYYLTLAITVPIALLRHKINVTGAAMMATYTANVWMGHVLGHWPHGFSHLWSLSIEEQFYLIAAALFLMAPARLHLLVCAAFISVAFASALILTLQHASPIAIYTDALVNFGPIAFGGVLFFGQEVARVSPPAFIVATLELTPLRWLGRVSYGFYLFHNFLTIYQMGPLARALGLRIVDSAPALIPVSFIAATVAATVSWHLIERPILQAGRRVALTEKPALA